MIDWALAAVALVPAVAGCRCDRFDVVLASGRVVDGAGSPKYRADIGVYHDWIVAIG